ncbi:MAG: hypothetical protein AAF414_16190 [Pseudomonadota bacterium]
MTKRLSDVEDHTIHYLQVGRRLQAEAIAGAFRAAGRLFKRQFARPVVHSPRVHHRPA